MRSLVGTGTAEDYEHGLRKNREISSDGPILDVRNVQILALLLRKIRTTGNLPRTPVIPGFTSKRVEYREP